MTKPVISFRLDLDLINTLTKQAEKENRSLNNLVETILKKHVENSKGHHSPPPKGTSSIEALTAKEHKKRHKGK